MDMGSANVNQVNDLRFIRRSRSTVSDHIPAAVVTGLYSSLGQLAQRACTQLQIRTYAPTART
jgi:hypothetical protein